ALALTVPLAAHQMMATVIILNANNVQIKTHPVKCSSDERLCSASIARRARWVSRVDDVSIGMPILRSFPNAAARGWSGNHGVGSRRLGSRSDMLLERAAADRLAVLAIFRARPAQKDDADHQ